MELDCIETIRNVGEFNVDFSKLASREKQGTLQGSILYNFLALLSRPLVLN